VHVPPPDATLSEVAFIKTMRGEAEFTMMPDQSHPLFPGQRTIMRFALTA
jgi:hypothetical protein